jgi:2',3'-cyclic-nucleotide 2'-phosphodiesterase (5'-nucleotidase family)
MVYPFQMCSVDVAMIGNHDLDFGVEKMQDIIKQTSSHLNSTNKNDCQWIVSNLVEK